MFTFYYILMILCFLGFIIGIMETVIESGDLVMQGVRIFQLITFASAGAVIAEML
ncbi:MAG: hypothetical protein ACRC6V_01110 [Bacteroidales bacterium]